MKIPIVVIQPEPDRPCEYCGEVAECRPYGVNGLWICFPCSQKPENIEVADKALCERFDKGDAQVDPEMFIQQLQKLGLKKSVEEQKEMVSDEMVKRVFLHRPDISGLPPKEQEARWVKHKIALDRVREILSGVDQTELKDLRQIFRPPKE